jgi:hypothetical protein
METTHQLLELIRQGPVSEDEIADAMGEPVDRVRFWCRNLRMEELITWCEPAEWFGRGRSGWVLDLAGADLLIEHRKGERARQQELAKPKPVEPAKPSIPVDPNGLRLDGPTLDEWIANGYSRHKYPPKGYAPR